MSPEISPSTLPAFYRLGTLADMSVTARKMALARKAIREIRKVEDYFKANKTNLLESEFNSGMKEMSQYSITVANAINETIVILKDMTRKIESYQEEIHDATN